MFLARRIHDVLTRDIDVEGKTALGIAADLLHSLWIEDAVRGHRRECKAVLRIIANHTSDVDRHVVFNTDGKSDVPHVRAPHHCLRPFGLGKAGHGGVDSEFRAGESVYLVLACLAGRRTYDLLSRLADHTDLGPGQWTSVPI